jgi:hypothetical protein
MSAIKVLSDLEFSRFRDTLPGFGARRLGLAALYVFLPLAGSFYLFSGHESPHLMFAVATLILCSLIMLMSIGHVVSFLANPQKSWWLTFPYSRLTLLYAKTAAMLRLGLRIGLILLIICIGHYGIAVYLDIMPALPLADLAVSIAAYASLSMAILPVAVAFCFLIMTLYHGWARWGVIPYLVLLESPWILLGLIMEFQDQYPWMTAPPYVWLYAGVVIVIGWPLAYGILRVSAATGMRNISDAHWRTKPSLGSGQDSSVAKSSAVQPGKGILSIYKLQRTRYTRVLSFLPLRIAGYAALLLLAVGSFFMASHPNSMLELSQGLFTLPVLAANLWSMNMNSIDMYKKRLQWWLGFPYPRSHLILAQLAAVWVTTVRSMLMLSAAHWIGVFAGMLVHPLDAAHLQTIVLWFVYSFLVFSGALSITLGMLQAAYYLMRNVTLSFLIVPLYILVALESTLINYLFPDSADAASGPPDWRPVWLLLIIGLPLAALCVKVGSKHIHVLLKQESSPRWARNSR